MAARKRKSTPFDTYQVTFEGGLQSNVRAQVVNELIKYILYERQQMPMTFDQLKLDIKRQAKLQQLKQNDIKQRTSLHNRMQKKKVNDLVTKLDSTLESILQAFEISPEIKKAAIIIGATPVSPKEVYLVELPPLSPEADNLSAQKCVKAMFYQLIKLDPLCKVNQIHPTNTTVMLFAPRHSELQWFYPKPQYKIPSRGKQFCFQLHSSCAHGSHNISKNFSLVDLSGFEPLDSSVDDVSLISDIAEEESASSSSKSSVLAEYICVDSDHDFDIIDNEGMAEETAQAAEDAVHSLEQSVSYETDCSKLSTASSKGSCKSLVTTSDILTRTSAFIKTLSVDSEDSPSRFSDVPGSQCCTEDLSLVEEMSEGSDASQEYIWFQSPVFLKGYRDKH